MSNVISKALFKDERVSSILLKAYNNIFKHFYEVRVLICHFKPKTSARNQEL